MHNNDNADINVCVFISKHFSPLLIPYHVSKCIIDITGFKSITRLQISLALFLSHETATTKLAILSFLLPPTHRVSGKVNVFSFPVHGRHP